MEDIQEAGDGVASRLPNLGLLDKSVVEERDSVLLFLVTAPRLAPLGLLPRCGARNVEPHLGHLVPPGRSLPALAWCRAILAVCFSTIADGELDGDLVATSKVGVRDLRVGDLEGGPVLHVERELGLAKLGLAPVPAAQRVFLVFQIGAVPALEDFAETLIVLAQYQPPPCRNCSRRSYLLLEAVQLDDARIPLQDFQLVAPGGPAPLCAADVALVEGEGVAAARGLPAQAVLGEPALALFPGQVQVDVVEALPVAALAESCAAACAEA